MRRLFPVLLVVLFWGLPASAAPWSSDLNCDGDTNVADVMLSILTALELPVSEVLDGNQDGVPDACAAKPLPESSCGYGTELSPNGTQCVVSQNLLDETWAAGVEAGTVSPPEHLVCACEDAYYGDVSWDPTFLVWEGSCAPWSVCAPGSFVSAWGTSSSDQLCVPCEEGVTFSQEADAEFCMAVTPCAPGMKEVVAPTLTTDRICSPIVVSLTLLDGLAHEGSEDPAKVRVTIDGPLDDTLVVELGFEGSALLGADIVVSGSGTFAGTQVTIQPGETEVVLELNPVVSPALEPTEKLQVMVLDSENYQTEEGQESVQVTVLEHGHFPGQTYYVSEDGNDQQDGSFDAPFGSVGYGVSQLTPGDTLFIMDGTYHNAGWVPDHGENGNQFINNPILAQVNVSGSADTWTRIAAYPDGNDVRPVLEFDGSGGIEFKPGTRYVVLEGLEIKGVNQEIQADWAHEHRWSKENFYKGRGIFSWGPVDHIVVRDCHVHHTPGSGIRFNKADYILVENNIVANTTWWSSSAESAIVIATAQHIDELDVVKFLYSGNEVYNNWNFMEFCNTPLQGQTDDAYGNCDTYSGGIIDGQGLYVTRNNDTYLHGRMRFENNVAYNNGFGGVVYHKTDRGELVNNLVFMNGAYPGDTKYSGMTLNTADDVLIINNVIWARYSNDYGLKNNGNASNVVATSNLVAGKTQFGADADNTYLLFDDAPVLSSLFAGASDISAIHPDPLATSGSLSPAEVGATLDAFALDFYPAETADLLIDAGQITGAPSVDMDGLSRPQGNGADRGPYEWMP